MTKNELLKRFKNEKVRETAYNLEGGLPNDRIVSIYTEINWAEINKAICDCLTIGPVDNWEYELKIKKNITKAH